MLSRVLVVGAGKVGRTLSAALETAGVEASLKPLRTLRPGALPRADLVVIATRDSQIEGVSSLLATRSDLFRAVVHCAGALGTAPLAPLAEQGIAVGTAHPCLSFASSRSRVDVRGAALVITGDRVAQSLARQLARALGMKIVAPADLDRALYHAACALTANGSAALVEASTRLFAAAGIGATDARRVLGPLLRSVASNVAALAPADALTGPVVRGDMETVRAHRKAIARAVPDLSSLFAAMVKAQEAVVARRTSRGGATRAGASGPAARPDRKALRDPPKMRRKRP